MDYGVAGSIPVLTMECRLDLFGSKATEKVKVKHPGKGLGRKQQILYSQKENDDYYVLYVAPTAEHLYVVMRFESDRSGSNQAGDGVMKK